jgi:hypothetical protein
MSGTRLTADRPSTRSCRTPRPGDVLLVDAAASVQFRGTAGLTFRVIRVDSRPTYDGWLWLHGYSLDKQQRAIEQRDIFVQVAGLKLLPASSSTTTRAPRSLGRAST